MNVTNLTRRAVLADRAVLAESHRQRLVGLLFHSRLKPGDGMVFPSCKGVHTWFMRFPIDVLFLDKIQRVALIVQALRPFRFSPVVVGASYAIELPIATIVNTDTRLGDIVTLDSA